MMSTYNYLYALSYVVFKVQSSSLFDQRLGLSGLEPPTSRLSGVRSNRLSYKPIFYSGSHLLSHTVSSIVSSAA